MCACYGGGKIHSQGRTELICYAEARPTTFWLPAQLTAVGSSPAVLSLSGSAPLRALLLVIPRRCPLSPPARPTLSGRLVACGDRVRLAVPGFTPLTRRCGWRSWVERAREFTSKARPCRDMFGWTSTLDSFEASAGAYGYNCTVPGTPTGVASRVSVRAVVGVPSLHYC